MLQLLEATAGIAFQPFQVAATLPLCLAVTLLQFFAARALNVLSQVADLAVERAHDVHGSVQPIDHAFALAVAGTAIADEVLNLIDLAEHVASPEEVFAFFMLFHSRPELCSEVSSVII